VAFAVGIRITPTEEGQDVAFPLVKFRILARKRLAQWMWFPTMASQTASQPTLRTDDGAPVA